MKVTAGSISYRAARRGGVWIGTVARCSLVGRFLLRVARVLGPVLAASLTFGIRYVGTRRLQRDGHPLSVLAVSRPYLWLRSTLGGGALGRATDAVAAAAGRSRFARGAWVWVVGAGIAGLGCGRVALLLTQGAVLLDGTGAAPAAPVLRIIISAIVVLVGLLVFVAGPRLLPAARVSLAGRGLALIAGGTPGTAAGPQERPAGGPVVVAATILAAVAGAAAGLASGSGAFVVVALVIAACLFALVIVRPEAMLVAVAAFPWLDWAARRLLGSLGPVWDDSLLIFSIALLLWSVIVLRRGELWTVPVTLPLLLALAAAVGSIVVREVPGDVALFAARVLFQPLLFYFLGFLLPKNRWWVRGAVGVFIAASVALALHGLYQYATHAPMPASWVDVRETDIGTRAYSIVQNPNGLGAFLLMGALVSLSLALARGLSRAHRVWSAVACLIQLAGIAVTFSRGAWIGLAAGVVALVLLAYRRYFAPLLAAGVVAWLAMPQAFVNRLTFAFSSAYITKSLAAGRLYVWKMSLQHMAAHPWFGVGLGTFGGTAAVTYGYGRLWVDNFYLQLGAEGGLLLLAFFLWILLRGAKGLVKGYAMGEGPYVRALCAGVFGAFVAVAVANLTASVWETLVVGVGFWFLSGLATSAALHGATGAAGTGEGRPLEGER
ncbi:MAG: O-antigen ligase family protein [Actinomycetia bacterium]|nr:O-antigen ligase family protein [Actinomycetes bacterium]